MKEVLWFATFCLWAQTAGVFGESEAEAVRTARAEGEETALSVSHRPHRCTVINCAKVMHVLFIYYLLSCVFLLLHLLLVYYKEVYLINFKYV